MKHDEDAADLLSEARRRPLSRDEEARLEEIVERSPEARILHYAGWSFDRDSSAREGDDVLVARLAARAAERHETPQVTIPLRRRRRPFIALIAAALAVAGTAGAGVGVVYWVRGPEQAPKATFFSSNAEAHQAGVKAKRARVPATLPDPVPPTAADPSPVAPPTAALAAPVVAPVPDRSPPVGAPASTTEPERARASTGVSSPKPRALASDALSARALFEEANKKRLAGDGTGAIALYKLLAERHPGSAEADLAELSLGKLMLGSGDAAGALLHFRLAQATGGALGSEALWGEAGALKTLGRAVEERAALERLLAQYPDGAYAKAARKRLGTDAP